jgi:hypothetical protein
LRVGEATLEDLETGILRAAREQTGFLKDLRNEGNAYHRRKEIASFVKATTASSTRAQAWIADWRRREHQTAREMLARLRQEIPVRSGEAGNLIRDLRNYLLQLRSLVLFETQIFPAGEGLSRAA